MIIIKVINIKSRGKTYDTVCMLSGGLDSYIGAIDLLEKERIKFSLSVITEVEKVQKNIKIWF